MDCMTCMECALPEVLCLRSPAQVEDFLSQIIQLHVLYALYSTQSTLLIGYWLYTHAYHACTST